MSWEQNATPWERTIRCPECNLMIGIRGEDRARTIVCERCRYFLGCVVKGGRRHARR